MLLYIWGDAMKKESGIVSTLKDKRISLGISQKTLAERCKMPQSTIGRFEANLISPRLDTVSIIAEKLGCEVVIRDNTQSKWNGTEIVAFWRDEVTAIVKIEKNTAHIERLTNDPMKQFFPPIDSMNLAALSELFETRCWDRGRADIDDILHHLGLKEYEPMEIVKRTFGVSYNDCKWFKFEPNNLQWENVCPRREDDV